MTKQSKLVEDKIREICMRRKGKKVETFEHVKSAATIVIDKRNGPCTSHGTRKIAGMGEFIGRFMQMLDHAETLNGTWVVAEALAQKGYVLLFNMSEEDVLDTLEKAVTVGEVMNA